jgi:hypothetical protein
MWEKEILAGIEQVLDEDGKFLPDFDYSRVRDSNPKLKRVKEQPFRKQVALVWQKHAERLKREKFYEASYEGPGNGVNSLVTDVYKSPSSKSP